MNGKPDIQIIQDIRAVVAITKEVLAKNPNATINQVIIGQIGSNTQLSKQQLSELERELLPVGESAEQIKVPTTKLMLPHGRTFDRVLPPDHIVDAVGEVLNQIEGYCYSTILKATLIAARRKYSNRKKAAEWLGLEYTTYCRWLNKIDFKKEGGEE